jgi:hypothetical protein
MIYSRLHNLAFLLIVIGTGLLLKSCSDNPASTTVGEHAPAIGFKLLLEDQVLVRYFQRNYEYDPEGNFPEFVDQDEGLLLSSEVIGGNRLENLRIRWIDRDGVIFDLAEFGEESGGTAGMPGEFNLRFVYLMPDGSRDEQPAEERPIAFIYDRDESTWTFDIELIQEGATEVRINLFHIDHDDLVSVPMPVRVEM